MQGFPGNRRSFGPMPEKNLFTISADGIRFGERLTRMDRPPDIIFVSSRENRPGVPGAI